MKKSLFCLIIIIGVCFQANAAVWTYNASEHMSCYNEYKSATGLEESFTWYGIGDWAITFTYDNSVLDTNEDPMVGFYQNAVSDVSFTFKQGQGTATTGNIELINNYDFFGEIYDLFYIKIPVLSNQMPIALSNGKTIYLDSIALYFNFYDSFTDDKLVSIGVLPEARHCRFYWFDDYRDYWSSGEGDSTVLIPEPATALILGLGVFVLSKRNKN